MVAKFFCSLCLLFLSVAIEREQKAKERWNRWAESLIANRGMSWIANGEERAEAVLLWKDDCKSHVTRKWLEISRVFSKSISLALNKTSESKRAAFPTTNSHREERNHLLFVPRRCKGGLKADKSLICAIKVKSPRASVLVKFYLDGQDGMVILHFISLEGSIESRWMSSGK